MSMELLKSLAIYGGGRRGHWPGVPGQDMSKYNLVRPLFTFVDQDKFNWFARVFPDTANVSLPSRSSFEDQVTVTPGSFLTMITTFSEQVEGFRFQVWDKGLQKEFFSAYSNERTTAGNSRNPRQLPFIVPAPAMITGTGLITVQMTNLSALANYAQVCLVFAVPRGGKVDC